MAFPTNLTLKTLLDVLRTYATKVRTEPDFCDTTRRHLKQCGYSGVDGTSNEQVMKVFAEAVNEAIQKKVDLTNQNTNVEEELSKLLKIPNNKSLNTYFKKEMLKNVQNASSPLHMAEQLKSAARQSLVTNIIQYQFEIKWATPTCQPAAYTFYDFCDKKNKPKKPTKKPLNHFTYTPRCAHVKATLYNESRKEDVVTLRNHSKEALCPKVYVLCPTGLKVWQADNPDAYPSDVVDNDLSWMNTHILDFIKTNADEQVGDLKQTMTKHTLYWAVLHDNDFKSNGTNLKLEEIGQTQVYVGKANKGIKGRWLKDSDNHCEMMKKCLDNVCAMTTYDPLRLEGVQLVDARLALAKIRNEETALFVIKTFVNDGNEKAETQLKKAERMHINGKRYGHGDLNIIPRKTYNMKWKPTKMGYGMNR